MRVIKLVGSGPLADFVAYATVGDMDPPSDDSEDGVVLRLDGDYALGDHGFYYVTVDARTGMIRVLGEECVETDLVRVVAGDLAYLTATWHAMHRRDPREACAEELREVSRLWRNRFGPTLTGGAIGDAAIDVSRGTWRVKELRAFVRFYKVMTWSHGSPVWGQSDLDGAPDRTALLARAIRAAEVLVEALVRDCDHDRCEDLVGALDGARNRCIDCGERFYYCHGCSEAGGADRAVYHALPICRASVHDGAYRAEV